MSTIYVVDDERAITDFVCDVLSEEGYRVTVCHDGGSALAQIIAEPPRLLLLDIGLPVISGDLVLQELRARGLTTLPVVVTTATTNAEQYLAMGANAVLKKPFALDNLLEVVATFLNKREQAPRLYPGS